MVSERVRVTIEGHVATVGLSRPDKHNALDLEMFEAIIAAIEQLRATAAIRAVILHGHGASFCSGLDLAGAAAALGSETTLARLREPPPTFFQQVSCGWAQLPVPVIAAIHGACFGGGLQIALGADIRIAAPDARLSIMEVRLGLIPDMGITRALPRLVGIDLAKELTFTGRVVSGEEAGRLGLVTRVADEPLAAARELADEIAARSPDAVRAAKRLYDEAWSGPAQQTLALEAELQLRLIGSRNQLTAAAASFGDIAPEFVDPA